MHDCNVRVPFVDIRLRLCIKPLDNLLRSSIAWPCSNDAHRRARIFLLEDGREIIVDVVNHVLVASCQNRKIR